MLDRTVLQSAGSYVRRGWLTRDQLRVQPRVTSHSRVVIYGNSGGAAGGVPTRH